MRGVKTLQTQDTSDPRHFGTSAKVPVRHFGTSAKLSGHIGTSAAEVSVSYTLAPRKTLWHRATLDQAKAVVDSCACVNQRVGYLCVLDRCYLFIVIQVIHYS